MQQDKHRVTSVKEVIASEVDDHKFSDLYSSLIVVADPFKSFEKLNTKSISCVVNWRYLEVRLLDRDLCHALLFFKIKRKTSRVCSTMVYYLAHMGWGKLKKLDNSEPTSKPFTGFVFDWVQFTGFAVFEALQIPWLSITFFHDLF